MSQWAGDCEEAAESAYDITRSQAFGPNRRYIQEQIDAVLSELREAYRRSTSFSGREAISRAAGRLNLLRNRFER